MDQLTFAQLLGNYGEFVGAIAVVATLGYLSLEVRRSRLATLASVEMIRSEQSIREVLADRESEFMPSLVVRARAGEALSEEELYRIDRTTILSITRLLSDFAQRKTLGLKIPRGGPFNALRENLEIFGAPVRERWSHFRSFTPQEFVEWVEGNVPELAQ